MTMHRKTMLKAQREIDDLRNTIEILMNVPNISLHIMGYTVSDFKMNNLKNKNIRKLRGKSNVPNKSWK